VCATPSTLGGFGLLLRQGVSQRLETHGQSIFYVTNVNKGGPAHTAGMRAEDAVESVDGQRVKTWDDAARLLLGGVGSSGSVRWHSATAQQHVSARIRRMAASPHDLEILVCQQRQRREGNSRGSSKGVLGQASAGWNWLKKQAGKEPSKQAQPPNNQVSKEKGLLSSSRRERSNRSSQQGHERTRLAHQSERGSVRASVSGGKSAWEDRSNQRPFGEDAIMRPRVEVDLHLYSHSDGGRDAAQAHTCTHTHTHAHTSGASAQSVASSRAPTVGFTPSELSPLTHNALAMWTGSWQEQGWAQGGGGGSSSHERVVGSGYLKHAVDLARDSERLASRQHSLLDPEKSMLSVHSSVRSSTRGESEWSEESDMGDGVGSEGGGGKGGWKKKVKRAMGRVVKEVSVVMGADKTHGLQLSRSTLQGKTAGVGVALARGAKTCVVIADVTPWIWVCYHVGVVCVRVCV